MTPSIEPQTLVFRHIQEGDVTSKFSLGDASKVALKIFLQAVKIARLAVDKALQGQGYGTKMVAWCLSLVKDKIMPVVGCRFLIVDAKADVVSFYENIGFTLLDTEENKQSPHPLMFLDLYKLS